MSYIEYMSQEFQLKSDYVLAKCCSPCPKDRITGYYSHNNLLKVHRHDCNRLKTVPPERLVSLRWSEIVAAEPFKPGDDYANLDQIDFAILKHHLDFGIDYSLVVARAVGLPGQEAFDRHGKLRAQKLLERVDATMVQYRKGIARHKWIKHRNHTYYRLTPKGERYLAYFLENRRVSD